jgi:sugar phosphate isomerase/epimerase
MPAPLISLAHLTLLQLSPPELVTVAANAGFDAVGLRLLPAVPGEATYAPLTDRALLTATKRRLDALGVRLLDAEVIRLRPETEPRNYRAFFEAARELDARFVLAISDDDEESRVASNLNGLAALGAEYGLRVVLEFISYFGIRTLASAVRVVTASGAGGVLLDALHLHRSGGLPADLGRYDVNLFPYVQLCDGPSAPPLPATAVALEGRARRLLPGEGDFPLAGLVASVPQADAFAVEAPSDIRDAAFPPGEVARLAYAAMQRILVPTQR